MSRSIELLARMHEVRSVTAEARGRQTLTGDVILAVFGRVRHKLPTGMDLLMAKYVHDAQAADRLITVMSTWLDDKPLQRKDLAMALSCVALNVFCDKPVASQHRQLSALWRKYSEQAKRSDRLVKRWQEKIKNLQRDVIFCSTMTAKERLRTSVNELESLIIKERLRIDNYARCQSRTSSTCPRCNGTGTTINGMCPSCGGHGMFVPTVDNVRQHLRHVGVGRVSDKLWDSELKPWFESCVYRLHVESQAATDLLTKALDRERE